MGAQYMLCIVLVALYLSSENVSCQQYDVSELPPTMQVSSGVEMVMNKVDTKYDVNGDTSITKNQPDSASPTEDKPGAFVEPSFTIHVFYSTGDQLVTDIPSVFDILSYNNTCSEEVVKINKACIVRKYETSHLEKELCKDFVDIIRLAYRYSCFYNVPSDQIVMKSQDYAMKLKSLKRQSSTQENDTYTDYVESGTNVENIAEFVQQTDAHGAMGVKIYHLQSENSLYDRIVPKLIPKAYKLREEVLLEEIVYLEMTLNLTNYLETSSLVSIFPYLYSLLLDTVQNVKVNILEDAQAFHKLKIYYELLTESNETFGRLDAIVLTIAGVLFFIGIIFNCLLLSVFVCFRETRTHANALLIHLTIVDTASLIFNVLVYYIIDKLFYFYIRCSVLLTLVICRDISFVLSVFSVVALSIQRYLAISNSSFNANPWISMKTKTIITISCIWVLGLIYSLSHLAFYENDGEDCKYDTASYSFALLNIEFCVLCLIPLVLFVIFSLMTSRKLTESVRNLPGERMGQNQALKSRTVSSNVIIGLMVIAVISYAPNYILLYIVYFNASEQVIPVFRNPTSLEYATKIAYILMFLNPCLNPLALYLMSKTFRKYFHAVLLCGRKSSTEDSSHNRPTQGQTTTTRLSN